MNSFLSLIDSMPNQGSSEVEFLRKSIKIKTVKKGTILQSQGDLDTNVYFVKSGLLRSYSIDKKGKEHIFMFASEDWLMGDNTPIGQPSELFIDAIEESQFEIIDRDLVAKILIPLTDGNEPQLKGLMKRISVLQERIIMLMSATAIERYEHFMETYPDIIQRAPQKMIASYLGITPEALSKVKGQRAKGN